MLFSKLYKLYLSPERHYIKALKALLGFLPTNVNLYRMAFRHRSAAVMSKTGAKNSNERLEFLGDAILGCVIAEELFKLYPYKGEGFLTEMRSKIVSRVSLNKLAKRLGLEAIIEFDHQTLNNTSKQSSILGDAFEALIGAVYIDKGYNFTRSFIIQDIIKPHIDISTLELTETNFKSKLIEWGQRNNKQVVFDLVTNEAGESAKLFTIQITIDGDKFALGRDYNKKNAEKIAAEKTCNLLAI